MFKGILAVRYGIFGVIEHSRSTGYNPSFWVLTLLCFKKELRCYNLEMRPFSILLVLKGLHGGSGPEG